MINEYFEEIFIRKIKQILSTDNNLYKKHLHDNENSYQISMVKAHL
jgi:hypothetical protein